MSIDKDMIVVCGGGGIWGVAWMTGLVAGLTFAEGSIHHSRDPWHRTNLRARTEGISVQSRKVLDLNAIMYFVTIWVGKRAFWSFALDSDYPLTGLLPRNASIGIFKP
jgi:hypothetical protein